MHSVILQGSNLRWGEVRYCTRRRINSILEPHPGVRRIYVADAETSSGGERLYLAYAKASPLPRSSLTPAEL